MFNINKCGKIKIIIIQSKIISLVLSTIRELRPLREQFISSSPPSHRDIFLPISIYSSLKVSFAI